MTTVRASVELDTDPSTSFEMVVEELRAGLARMQIELEPRLAGVVTEGETTIGQVIAWEPGQRILLEWRPADWAPREITEIELRFEPLGTGTRLTLEHRGWG
ncbi:MAG: SRPBCC domain-containing protein, partial [Chloroflexi bacterium]|nr:SRPBCC domain-containing protein [Chloroflexota bacterium]